MNPISSRHKIIKVAGPKERKRGESINFNILSKTMEGSDQSEIIDLARNGIENGLTAEHLAKIEQLVPFSQEISKKSLDQQITNILIIGSVFLGKDTDFTFRAFSKFLTDSEWTPKQIRDIVFNNQNLDVKTLQEIVALYDIFTAAQDKYYADQAKLKQQTEGKEYITNEIVFKFEDGWTVKYLPASNETKPYPGLPGTSHDRILEGNLNGLCLGSGSKLYQDNSNRKVYSVRDQSNHPKLTIGISTNGESLLEAKGKNNLVPDVETAKHANIWFANLKDETGFDFERNSDYLGFPPTTIETATRLFNSQNGAGLQEKWISSWYKMGIEPLDDLINKAIKDNNYDIILSNMHLRYPDLIEPILIDMTNRAVEGDFKAKSFVDLNIFARYPTHEIFSKFKSREWCSRLLKFMAGSKPDIYLDMYAETFPQFKKLAEACQDPIEFLTSTRPGIKDPEIKSMVLDMLLKTKPIEFLSDYRLSKEFPEMRDIALEKCSKIMPEQFLDWAGHQGWNNYEVVEDLRNASYESLAKNEPKKFLTKPKYYNKRPDLIESARTAHSVMNNVSSYDYVSVTDGMDRDELDRATRQSNDCAAYTVGDINSLLQRIALCPSYAHKIFKIVIDAVGSGYTKLAKNFFLTQYRQIADYINYDKELMGLVTNLAKSMAEADPYWFLFNETDANMIEWFGQLEDVAVSSFAENNPVDFVNKYGFRYWDKETFDKFKDIAGKEIVERFPEYLAVGSTKVNKLKIERFRELLPEFVEAATNNMAHVEEVRAKEKEEELRIAKEKRLAFENSYDDYDDSDDGISENLKNSAFIANDTPNNLRKLSLTLTLLGFNKEARLVESPFNRFKTI